MAKRFWNPGDSTVERLPNDLVVSCEEPGIMAAAHWHAQAEVNYVFRGHVEYDMGGLGVRLNAGDLALFWGGQPHRVVDTGDDTYFHAVHLPLLHFFRLRLSAGLQARLMRGAALLAGAPSADDAAAFERRAGFLRSDDPKRVGHGIDELLLRLERLELEDHRLIEPTGAGAEAGADQPGFPSLRRICRFVAENFREDIDSAAIAGSADIHPKYAMSVFKRSTGMTLGEYVGLLRISYAQALLLDEDASVLRVAMESGFGSVSAFNKLFRKKAGTTPSAFKRERRALAHPPP